MQWRWALGDIILGVKLPGIVGSAFVTGCFSQTYGNSLDAGRGAGIP